MREKWLIAVHGPTASGKTRLAIELARYYKTEIISADSRQFYNELRVGVARPSVEELAAVPHHFIAFKSVHELYSAGQFEQDALRVAYELFSKVDIVIATGGSGLYLKALLTGLDELPSDPIVRAEICQSYNERGIQELRDELKLRDPVYYHQTDLSNPRRLIRALEVCRVSGKSFSELRINKSAERDFGILQIGLQADRKWLYQRINERVDEMVSMGLEEEARGLYALRHLNALQTVGYKEWFDYFEGLTTREQGIEKIKQHTRNYAKRQMTWYAREQEIKWFRADHDNRVNVEVIAEIENILGKSISPNS